MTGDQEVLSEVLQLLTRVPRPPGAARPVGATQAQLTAGAAALGVDLPSDVQAWLRRCNGVVAGPGVLLGVGTADPQLDAVEEQRRWPGWRTRSWVPVATDGTGNGYVVDASSGPAADGGVYFVDGTDDPDALAYVVASSLPRFLQFLLPKELGETRWPFDRAYVLSVDPELAHTVGAPLPWDA